jgi:hypothetical protein
MTRDRERRQSRREFIADVGLGSAALFAGRAPGLLPAEVPRGDQLAELARRLCETKREQVFDVVADLARADTDYRTVLGAVFLAGIRAVRPRGVGSKLHCVLVVESMFQLAEPLSPYERWRLVLWNVQHFKTSQAESAAEGDWNLSPRPEAKAASADRARAEFLAAVAAYDDDRADRATVALIPFHDHQSFFELMWPLGARYHYNIGHKAIYLAQAERVLRRIGWQHAEPVLRSLVHALLYTGRTGPGKDTIELSESNAGSIPDGWLRGREEPAQSAALLRELRGKPAAERQQLVIAALRQGWGLQTVWDALRLAASELVVRRRSSDPANRSALLPVHALTVTNAARHVFGQSRVDRTRRLLLLQAAGWQAFLEADLYGQGLGAAEVGIDTLPAAAPAPDLEALYACPSPRAAVDLLGQRPELHGPFAQRLRTELSRSAVESHQHKYCAAALEECALASPRWAAHVIAPSVPYLPTTERRPATEFAERSHRALVRAGLA